MGDIQP